MEEKMRVLPEMRETIEQELGLVSGPPRIAEAGHNRILNRGRFDGMTVGRGGGAYFSFETGLNDYNQGPDLELQGWGYSSGFYGGSVGFVTRLEGNNLDGVTMDDIPGELKKATVEHQDSRGFRSAVSAVGGVYAVRAYRSGASDILAIFQVTDQDEYGAGFDWKIMKVFPKPSR